MGNTIETLEKYAERFSEIIIDRRQQTDIQQLTEQVTSLRQNYRDGKNNLKDLSKDYQEHKEKINTFIGAEEERNASRIDKIAEHDDQIKNLESDSEAGKKHIKDLRKMIEKQNEQIVHLGKLQREQKDQCIKNARKRQREIEICQNRIRACEIQAEGLVKTAKETTDGLRYINNVFLKLIHTEETDSQNNNNLQVY